MSTKSAEEVIAEISAQLMASDGEFIEFICNQVCDGKVKYVGDSLFECAD